MRLKIHSFRARQAAEMSIFKVSSTLCPTNCWPQIKVWQIYFPIREILLDLKWEIQWNCKRNQNRPEQPKRMTSLMLLLLSFFNGLPWVLARNHYFSLTDDYDKYIPFSSMYFFSVQSSIFFLFSLHPPSSSWSWSSPTLTPGLRSQDKSFPIPLQSLLLSTWGPFLR